MNIVKTHIDFGLPSLSNMSDADYKRQTKCSTNAFYNIDMSQNQMQYCYVLLFPDNSHFI